MKEGPDERYFLQQLSLAFFYGRFVNILVISKHNVGINGKVKHVLSA